MLIILRQNWNRKVVIIATIKQIRKQTVQPKGSNLCVSTDYNTLPVESE